MIDCRRIQLRSINNVKQGKDHDDIFSSDDGSKDDLSWWSSCPDNLTPLSFIPLFPDLAIYTDASRKDWGACLSLGFSAAGIWPPGFHYHINYLELKAIYNGLLALLPHVKNCGVKIMSDNIYSVFYINKLRGTHSPKCPSLH